MNGVLFVCHANLCRSPMAEYIARAVFAGALPADRAVPVSSAGTHAIVGRAMHPFAAEVLAGQQLDVGGFRSREVTREVLTDAALILTASRRERAYCVSLAPGALRRTFTLRQFSRLAVVAEPVPAGAPGARGASPDTCSTPVATGSDLLSAVVAAAALARGRLQPAAPQDDDLPDPIGGAPAGFRRCAIEIEEAVRPIAALIAAAG